ncbi:hypothetical protein EVAR_85642_1 [Eumeta japonica]|uniref:Uncharacterized protein n=1 Tax=Eumeta variegata TaxID=151549 RepID=A0A4C1XWH4_EUMVA|nr:hypothetical protein EVAR_85642_1 [Eumeta japonica]
MKSVTGHVGEMVSDESKRLTRRRPSYLRDTSMSRSELPPLSIELRLYGLLATCYDGRLLSSFTAVSLDGRVINRPSEFRLNRRTVPVIGRTTLQDRDGDSTPHTSSSPARHERLIDFSFYKRFNVLDIRLLKLKFDSPHLKIIVGTSRHDSPFARARGRPKAPPRPARAHAPSEASKNRATAKTKAKTAMKFSTRTKAIGHGTAARAGGPGEGRGPPGIAVFFFVPRIPHGCDHDPMISPRNARRVRARADDAAQPGERAGDDRATGTGDAVAPRLLNLS